MSIKAPVWEPSNIGFEEQKDAIDDFRGEVISSETIKRERWIINTLSTVEEDSVDFIDEDNLFNAINTKVNMDSVEASKGRHVVTLESLYKIWLISSEAARRTVHHTTQ